jgi:hypothetical protein
MTTDEFNARYKLLKQIAHGEGRSFTAQECASERAVLVHFLTEEGHPPDATVATLIDRLSPRDRSKILEILAVNLSTVVVTQFLEDFESFGTWLRSRLAAPPEPAPEPSPQSPPPLGEFTKLFEPPADSAASAPPPPVPSMPAPSMPAASMSSPESPQGSFTELFRTPPEPKASPYPIPAPATPPVEIRSVRMRLGEPMPPPRPAAPLPSWPASFEPPQAPPLPKPMLPSRRAGEPIVKPPPREQLPPPSPLPGWSGESDYTRQLRPAPPPGPADPAPPVVAPLPSAEPAAGGTRSLVPLLLVLNIVVIIATGLILYFALKRR